MPDFSGSSRTKASWVTAGDPGVVRAALLAALRDRRARLASVSADGPLEAVLGSRFGFRMLGFLAPPAWVPMRLTASVTAAEGGSRLDLEAASDEGWYLGRVDSLVNRVSSKGFAVLFDELREVAPPTV